MTSWRWPDRPARVPRAWAAGLLAGLGAVLFGTCAVLLKAGATGWDVSLFRILNEVPPAVASVLTPLLHLFPPAGIIVVVVLIAGYVVAWVLAGVAIAYAVLVGWSRVYLGVHYPLDVLAGAGIGMAVGVRSCWRSGPCSTGLLAHDAGLVRR